MARLPRLNPVGIPQHVIQRGNNRQVCFSCNEDFTAYAYWLGEKAEKYGIEIHAFVLMTNHVHLLVTPTTESAIPKMMQDLGRLYVRYFNREYRRSGTLWEGRYKSCLVQTEQYLLECSRYIELNPVRADMVDDPAEYTWSSYQGNALGKEIKLLTPHEEYLRLGKNQVERQRAYRDLFEHHVDVVLIRDIRDAVNRGMALGNDRFKNEIEKNLGRRVRPAKMGRPKVKQTQESGTQSLL
jgi:putative transposase